MRRRDAIKTLGALAGAAATLPGCNGAPEDLADAGIDTFVFLMMENRSYDHCLGARALAGLGGDGLTPGMSNPDSMGVDVPLWPGTDETMCVLDPPHGWGSSRAQWAGGSNDGFLIAHEDRHGPGNIEALQYLMREHQPVTNALADAYTVCDRWFSSVLGPTLPNRMYWHAGTSNGGSDNGDILAGAFDGIPTVHHRLRDVGVDWAYYFQNVPVLGVLDGLETEGHLRRFYFDFIDDAAAGRLPPVVYIDPAFAYNDDHPPQHPLLGQQVLAATYQALATSPHWERCLLVITYDEHGGFYDHVSPPTTEDDFAAQGFDQLGFRVPTLVVGPYAKTGAVVSTQYDHTSPLKHLQNHYGLAPLSTRVSTANDLSDCIDQERLAAGTPTAPIELPPVEVSESILSGRCGADKVGHDMLEWAEANSVRLGKYDRRHEALDQVYGIAEYLDQQGLGRIRRGR